MIDASYKFLRNMLLFFLVKKKEIYYFIFEIRHRIKA